MNKCLPFFLSTLIAILMTACEKVSFDNMGEGNAESSANVRIIVAGTTDDASSTTRADRVNDICTRLNFAFYQEGKRVKSINQKAADKDFGSIATTLEAGTYQMLILAHSGNGNPTTTDPQKMAQFNSSVADLSCADCRI